MKAASSTLIQFLENATEFVRADLYSFALNGGAVLRYSSCGLPITYNGAVYNIGPPIQDGGVQSTRGMNPPKVDITLHGGDGRFTVNGLDILDFIEGFGLDRAVVSIDRVFAASWSDMAALGPVGGFNRFKGYAGEIKEHGQTQSVVTVDAFSAVLQTAFPSETYGTSCLNTFGDADCGVNVAALAKTGAVASVDPTAPMASFGSSLTDPDGYWTLGVIVFTSGGAQGLSRSIKAYGQSGGGLQLTSPLPAPPAVGDAFTVTPGCLLSLAACQGWDSPPAPASPPTRKFNLRFRGTPFIPPPSTGLPS